MTSQRAMRAKPSSNPLSLRHFERALQNPYLGFALRGTSWHEGVNRRKKSSSKWSSQISSAYVFQAPTPRDLPKGREFISRLRATILATASFSLGRRNVVAWRSWRHTFEYPAILLVRNKDEVWHLYRGGYDEAFAGDYADRRKDVVYGKLLHGFPKEPFAPLRPGDIAAIIRPTKREMSELEAKILKKTNAKTIRFAEMMNEGFRRLMVSKTVQAIQRVYASELEHAKKK